MNLGRVAVAACNPTHPSCNPTHPSCNPTHPSCNRVHPGAPLDKNTGVLAVRATPNGIAAMAEWRVRLAVSSEERAGPDLQTLGIQTCKPWAFRPATLGVQTYSPCVQPTALCVQPAALCVPGGPEGRAGPDDLHGLSRRQRPRPSLGDDPRYPGRVEGLCQGLLRRRSLRQRVRPPAGNGRGAHGGVAAYLQRLPAQRDVRPAAGRVSDYRGGQRP